MNRYMKSKSRKMVMAESSWDFMSAYFKIFFNSENLHNVKKGSKKIHNKF